MSLFGFLSVGSQALLTGRKAIDITNENIANQYSDSYAKQSPVIQDVIPTGVNISKIERVFDNSLYNRFLNVNQKVSGDKSYTDLLSEVETLFNDIQGSGFYESINKFFNSFNDVAINPNDPAARDVVISEARQLISKIRNNYSNMKRINEEISLSIKEDIKSINNIINTIAKLNESIKTFSNDESRLNNYLNQRDKLLKDLSKFIDMKVVYRNDRTTDIYTVKGFPLVLYNEAKPITYTSSDKGVIIRVDGTDITSLLKNGTLGGKLRAINFINRKISDLNDFTSLLTASVNKIHRQGYDLNGNTGIDFFKISPDSSLNHIDASNIDLNITDYTQIAASSDPRYLNSDNSIAKAIVSLRNFNEISTKTTATAVSSTATFGGGSFDVILDNKKIATINYTATDTISNIVNKINSSQKRVVAQLYENPPGSGNFYVQLYAKDIKLSPSIKIQNDTGNFVSSTGGITNLKSLFNSQEKNNLTSTNGLTIGSTSYKVSSLENLNILDTKSFQELYTKKFTSEIGLSIKDAKENLKDNKIFRDSLDKKIKEKSAVNIDEELANLVKYQRAYQSAAKIINVTDELLQTILGLVK